MLQVLEGCQEPKEDQADSRAVQEASNSDGPPLPDECSQPTFNGVIH